MEIFSLCNIYVSCLWSVLQWEIPFEAITKKNTGNFGNSFDRFSNSKTVKVVSSFFKNTFSKYYETEFLTLIEITSYLAECLNSVLLL